MPKVSIGDIVDFVEGGFEGDRSTVISGVRSLSEATPSDLSFLSNPRYRPQLEQCRAGAILVARNLEGSHPSWVRVDDPYLALARVLTRWFDERPYCDGISPKAEVHASARIGSGARIGAFAAIGRDAVIGEGVTILEGAVIGEGTVIGAGTLIHPNVTIYRRSVIGRNCVIHAGAVIGSDGYGFATARGVHNKIPQVGIVRIEDDVEVGSGTTIDRAALGETVIGQGTKIDNLVQIGHNVRIGRHCLIVALTGISGSTELGDNVVLAGQSGTYGHIRIGNGMKIGARGVVTRDWDTNETISGFPARPVREHLRNEAAIRRLPDLLARMREVEKLLGIRRRAGDRPGEKKGEPSTC